MPGPLHGLKIVEVVGLGPSSFTAMMLADMGAEVVRIDRRPKPGVPNPYPVLGTRYDVMARGRPSLTLDLKTPEGVAVALDMIAAADALLEGFRPGVMERLGLGPDACLARNPRLVYTRVTGWGQTGPLAQTAGHDINYIALSGMLAAMGAPGSPPPPPLNLVGDFGGGGMLAAFGVVCGILHAQRTGEGQMVDAAMLDGTNLLGAMIFGLRSMGGWSLERGRNWIAVRHPITAATNAPTASTSPSARSSRISSPPCWRRRASIRPLSAMSATSTAGRRCARRWRASSACGAGRNGASCWSARMPASRPSSTSTRPRPTRRTRRAAISSRSTASFTPRPRRASPARRARSASRSRPIPAACWQRGASRPSGSRRCAARA